MTITNVCAGFQAHRPYPDGQTLTSRSHEGAHIDETLRFSEHFGLGDVVGQLHSDFASTTGSHLSLEQSAVGGGP